MINSIKRWLFRAQKNNTSIVHNNNNFTVATISKTRSDLLINKKKISLISQELFQAQLTRLRANISNKSNFILDFQKNWYDKKISESIEWNKERLLFLYKEKKELESKLEILTGKVWVNRIKRWFIWFLGSICCISIIGILLMGLFTAFYLSPLILVCIFIYYMYKKSKY